MTAPTAPVVAAAAPATVADGVVSVTVTITATDPIVGAFFRVDAPETFTLTDVAYSLEAASEEADGLTLTGGETVALPYSIALLHMKATENTVENATATLTFAVDADAELPAVVTVTALEAYNASEKNVAFASVSAEVTAATETPEPECEHTNTKLVSLENGFHNVVCASETCGAIVEENVACTMEEVEDSAVAPDFDVPGKYADTKCVCGYTVAGEEIPALVAKAAIGDTKYETVQAALSAAKALDTVTVMEGVTETVAPAVTVYLAGDIDGITLAESCGFVLHSTTVDKYTGEKDVKNILRPEAATAVSIGSNTTMTYEAAIKMDFYALASKMDTYADFYAILTINATTPRTYIVTEKIGGMLQGEAAYKYTYPMIAAKEMGDTIDCTFVGIKADGSIEYRVRSSSVLDYCKALFKNAGVSAEEKDLMVAILSYGADAQNFFGYKTDALVTADLTADQKAAYAAKYAVTTATKTNSKQDVEGITNTVVGLQTALNFEDSIQLNIQILLAKSMLTNNSFDGLTLVAEFAGQKVEFTAEDVEIKPYDNSNMLASMYVTTIAAKDMRADVTFTLYRNYGTEAQVQVNGYRTTGIEQHITKINQTNISEAEKKLNIAILTYADAANAFFAK